jgi:hypothetical protein
MSETKRIIIDKALIRARKNLERLYRAGNCDQTTVNTVQDDLQALYLIAKEGETE